MTSRGGAIIYRLGLEAVRLTAQVVALGNAKVARGLAGRRGALARMAAWSGRQRDPARPLLWMHAPSVGEGLQAKPVLERLRRRHPDWQLAYTFFSPSAERFAASLAVDVADYLPFDLPGPTAAVLDQIRPTALVFTAADVWPELALGAAKRGVRLGLASAAIRTASGRLRWPIRSLLFPAYAALDRIGAVDRDHARRLTRLGCRSDRISVTGDTRYDSAVERAAGFDRERGLGARLRSATASTLVAGSTWPGDEAEVLAAFAEVRARRAPRGAVPRLILAPHEPRPAHLEEVRARAAGLGLPSPVALDHATPDSEFVLVDRVGVLADLYAAADLAYVGGGYHRAGLHSVLEPAVFGVPVVVGPRWSGSRDAAAMLERGGAVALPEVPEGRAQLTAQWLVWLADPAARQRTGTAARAVLESGLGAADRTADMVEELVRGVVRG
jgi:3-deoxy-D-manno-octulosonic-acid transferase